MAASAQFYLKRSDYGATLKEVFFLKNDSDVSIVVGTAPTALGTHAVMTGTVKTIAKLKT